MGRFTKVSRESLLLTATTVLLAGGVARLSGPAPAQVLWAIAVGVALAPTVAWVVADLRAGRWGADPLAVLALGGTVAVGEFLAGRSSR